MNNTNRENLQAEFAQLVAEIDRVALSTSYNNTVLLTGFGNTISQTQSTALTASATTGVAGVTLSGAEASTYVFIDSDPTDNQITVGNGIATQTIDIGRSSTTTLLVGLWLRARRRWPTSTAWESS